jgi:MtN3 and saliva related transmembrane protein
MTPVDAVGWCASAVLLATILRQVWKQWRERSSEGVSKWLFAGQTTASAGFVAYSWLLGNPVFVVTNAALLLAALAGWWIQRRNARLAHARGRED